MYNMYNMYNTFRWLPANVDLSEWKASFEADETTGPRRMLSQMTQLKERTNRDR